MSRALREGTRRANLVRIVNDIRLNYGDGQGTLGEVADRIEALFEALFEEGPEWPLEHDVAPCVAAHEHLVTQRHNRHDCPEEQA